MVTQRDLDRSEPWGQGPGEFGLAYQSVMMTPLLASAWSSGAKDTVSSAAR